MPSRFPLSVGPYTLLETLGRGSMGVVYRASDQRRNRIVALKTMIVDSTTAPERKKRFNREANLAAQLDHPHIIKIFELGEEAGRIYIAMELLEGSDLKHVLKSEKTIRMPEKLRWMNELAGAIGFAHDKGIIHRDIKPSNVWIRTNRKTVVMDFGIARPPASDLTRAGVILGTPDYISPEQILSVRPDQRTDIFLLGILFYEMLTGTHPFLGESLTGTAHNLLNEQPRQPHLLNPEIPENLGRILIKALEKNMNQRYQSCNEMLQDLQPFLNES